MDSVVPTVRYLIVCEDVYVDPDNPRRVTLVGLVSAIRAKEKPAYPIIYPAMCVYLQMTECRGSANGRVEIRHADSDRVQFRTQTRTIPFGADPLEVVGVIFRVRNCLFPTPGLYWVQFWYNDQIIAQQPVVLR